MTATLFRGGPVLTFDADADADAEPVTALVVQDGRVVAHAEGPADTVVELAGRAVLPGFVDSHTHLVFGGDRLAEFSHRVAGAPYRAGGIHATVAATRAATRDELLGAARTRAAEALRTGTTTLEVKSGYGLTVADERRLLDVAREVTPHTTFLGAHVPAGPDPAAYRDLVAGAMLDACAPVSTAIDAFCDDGAFDADACRQVLRAGQARGLGVHVHANQLGPGPGAQLAAELGALSADHCTHLDRADIAALADSGVVAVLTPAAELLAGTRSAPARQLLDAGVTVALASDCNPGTAFTTSLPLVIALACHRLRLSPAEAVRAATVGGAAALGVDAGHLRLGAPADLVVLRAPSPDYLAYRPGVDLIDAVWRAGRCVAGSPR